MAFRVVDREQHMLKIKKKENEKNRNHKTYDRHFRPERAARKGWNRKMRDNIEGKLR